MIDHPYPLTVPGSPTFFGRNVFTCEACGRMDQTVQAIFLWDAAQVTVCADCLRNAILHAARQALGKPVPPSA